MEPFTLPPLPYPTTALEPHLSQLTLRTHHGRHHKAYLEKLNAGVQGTPKAAWSLERLVRDASGPLFQNAAQAWNHEFYWHSLRPAGGARPPAELSDSIRRDFGGLGELRRAFDEAALAHFGSGWAWLVANPGGRLAVLTTHDADTPLRDGPLPLLTCDLWEHAWYIDRRHDKAAYLKAFWQVADWSFAAANLERGAAFVSAATPERARSAAGRRR